MLKDPKVALGGPKVALGDAEYLGEAEDMGDGANGGKVRQDYLNRYFPDGRNEMHAWAMSHVRGLAPSATHTPFGPEGLLGESDEDLLRLFSLHKQHQPIKSQAYEGKTEVHGRFLVSTLL